MNMARVCCCAPAMSSCCDFWACSGNASPKSFIAIFFTTTVERTYDTGETIELSKFEWSVESVGAFTRQGANCTAGLWDGCDQAKVTWNLWLKTPYFEHIGTGSTLDGTTETATPTLCAGCVYPGPSCNYIGAMCIDVEQHFYGVQTVTGTVDALRYECHTGCDGCARPMISYTPPSAVLNGLFSAIFPCVCGSNQPDIPPEAAVINFNGFSIGGKCGCPTTDTWDDPISLVFGFGSGPGQCGSQGIPYNGCILACDCEKINSPLHVMYYDKVVYNWYCQDFYPDPFNPVTIVCERSISYIDRCVQTMQVVVS